MGEVEYVESRSPYRCSCPAAQSDEDEIRLALSCWERELAAGQAAGGEEEQDAHPTT